MTSQGQLRTADAPPPERHPPGDRAPSKRRPRAAGTRVQQDVTSVRAGTGPRQRRQRAGATSPRFGNGAVGRQGAGGWRGKRVGRGCGGAVAVVARWVWWCPMGAWCKDPLAGAACPIARCPAGCHARWRPAAGCRARPRRRRHVRASQARRRAGPHDSASASRNVAAAVRPTMTRPRDPFRHSSNSNTVARDHARSHPRIPRDRRSAHLDFPRGAASETDVHLSGRRTGFRSASDRGDAAGQYGSPGGDGFGRTSGDGGAGVANVTLLMPWFQPISDPLPTTDHRETVCAPPRAA